MNQDLLLKSMQWTLIPRNPAILPTAGARRKRLAPADQPHSRARTCSKSSARAASPSAAARLLGARLGGSKDARRPIWLIGNMTARRLGGTSGARGLGAGLGCRGPGGRGGPCGRGVGCGVCCGCCRRDAVTLGAASAAAAAAVAAAAAGAAVAAVAAAAAAGLRPAAAAAAAAGWAARPGRNSPIFTHVASG